MIFTKIMEIVLQNIRAYFKNPKDNNTELSYHLNESDPISPIGERCIFFVKFKKYVHSQDFVDVTLNCERFGKSSFCRTHIHA